MLDFQKNRLDYGNLLCPPQGYYLDRALATTYSLDLNALLAVPVALFYAQTLEGDLTGEHLALLEAVQKLGDRVTIFHQAGKVQIPKKYNRLFAYLERCLVPVSPDFARQSFHPKVWVIRFLSESKKNPVRFRLLVLSRNLTFDRSWDVAANLEGEVGNDELPENAPLVNFVSYLLKMGGEKLKGGRPFLQQLKKAAFKVPSAFEGLRFHPIGIENHKTGIPSFAPEHLVIVSPFLHDDALLKFRSENLRDAFLFSRLEELKGLGSDALSIYQSYHLNQLVVEGERTLDSADECDSQDLHAKLYIQTRKGESRWFLGSANATSPAAGNCNIEFMLELRGRGAEIQGPRLVDVFLGEDGKKGIFVKYEAPSSASTDAKASLKQKLRELENKLVRAGLKGELVPAEDTARFDLMVTSSLSPSELGEFLMQLFPLGFEKAAQGVSSDNQFSLCFDNIPLPDLSIFMGVVILHPDLAETRRFLLQMEIALPDDRLDRIFALLIKNKERFFEYLRFLLADNPSKDSLLPPRVMKGGTSGEAAFHFNLGAVYEDLLLAASRSPEKLAAIEKAIRRLMAESTENDIIPPEFLALWQYFKGYIANV